MPLTVIVERVPSESLPVVVMVWVALSFIFFEAHTAGNAWPVCGRGGGGIRVFGRALAQGARACNLDNVYICTLVKSCANSICVLELELGFESRAYSVLFRDL